MQYGAIAMTSWLCYARDCVLRTEHTVSNLRDSRHLLRLQKITSGFRDFGDPTCWRMIVLWPMNNCRRIGDDQTQLYIGIPSIVEPKDRLFLLCFLLHHRFFGDFLGIWFYICHGKEEEEEEEEEEERWKASSTEKMVCRDGGDGGRSFCSSKMIEMIVAYHHLLRVSFI